LNHSAKLAVGSAAVVAATLLSWRGMVASAFMRPGEAPTTIHCSHFHHQDALARTHAERADQLDVAAAAAEVLGAVALQEPGQADQQGQHEDQREGGLQQAAAG